MSHDPLDLDGIAVQEAAQADAERESREQEEADLGWLMSSKRGRRMVWRLLDRAGVFRTSFATNALAMAFAEGNRNGGLGLLHLIHRVCPQLYQVMVKEQQADDAGDESRKHTTN